MVQFVLLPCLAQKLKRNSELCRQAHMSLCFAAHVVLFETALPAYDSLLLLSVLPKPI